MMAERFDETEAQANYATSDETCLDYFSLPAVPSIRYFIYPTGVPPNILLLCIIVGKEYGGFLGFFK